MLQPAMRWSYHAAPCRDAPRIMDQPLTCFIGGLAAGNVQLHVHARAVAAGMQLSHRLDCGQEGAVAVQAAAAGRQAVDLRGKGGAGEKEVNKPAETSNPARVGGPPPGHPSEASGREDTRVAHYTAGQTTPPAPSRACTWEGGASGTSSTSYAARKAALITSVGPCKLRSGGAG